MTRHQTYYDLFGVPPSATLREIRGAYIELMKRHHPDTRHADDDDADGYDMVATANRYYAVLKDPRKRAAYDGQLFQIMVQPATNCADLNARKAAPSWALLVAIAAAVVALGGAIAIAHTAGGTAAGDRMVATDGRDGAQATSAAMPSAEDVEEIVRRAVTMSGTRAAATSHQCYANARAIASERAAQECVIFDEAALYSAAVWRDNLLASTYFNPDLVQVRQSGALAPFDGDGAVRLEQLRTTALRQVLKEAQVDTVPITVGTLQTGN